MPFANALQCLTDRFDNNTVRIPSLACLSKPDHQLWCLTSTWVACGFKPDLNYPTSFIRPFISQVPLTIGAHLVVVPFVNALQCLALVKLIIKATVIVHLL